MVTTMGNLHIAFTAADGTHTVTLTRQEVIFTRRRVNEARVIALSNLRAPNMSATEEQRWRVLLALCDTILEKLGGPGPTPPPTPEDAD